VKRGAATSHLVRKDPQTERHIETDKDMEKTEPERQTDRGDDQTDRETDRQRR
jgi:hypothetical protein